MKSQLIINADDFGDSESVVDAILALARKGSVTSTSIMATGKAFDYGITRARAIQGDRSIGLHGEMPDLSFGVHLDATTGIPLSAPDEIPSLLDQSGRFRQWMQPGSINGIETEHLEREFRRQIERVLNTKIDVTHLDNHLNWIYFDTRLFRVVTDLAREFDLPLRFPFGGMSSERADRIASHYRIPMAEFTRAISETTAIIKEVGVRTADQFWIEFTSIDRSEEAIEHFITELRPGITELCVHPGGDTPRQIQEYSLLTRYPAQRLLEIAPNIELKSFTALRRSQ